MNQVKKQRYSREMEWSEKVRKREREKGRANEREREKKAIFKEHYVEACLVPEAEISRIDHIWRHGAFNTSPNQHCSPKSFANILLLLPNTSPRLMSSFPPQPYQATSPRRHFTFQAVHLLLPARFADMLPSPENVKRLRKRQSWTFHRRRLVSCLSREPPEQQIKPQK